MKNLNLWLFVFSLLILFQVPGMAQTRPEDDFEVVVPGQTPTPAKSPSPDKTPEVKPIPSPTVVISNVGNTKKDPKQTAGTKKDIPVATNAPTGSLPLRVEVSDQQPTALITLAVGAATRFQTEERPSRLVIGNLTDIGVTKAGSGNWNGFYLRPTSGGISTNMFIEFASGSTVMINLKTVAPKLLRPGDYNSEVYVKTAAVRSEIIALRAENSGLKEQLNVLKNQPKPNLQPIIENPNEGFELIEKAYPLMKNNGSFWIGADSPTLKIKGLTPFLSLSDNTGYVALELTSKEKTPMVITAVTLNGADGTVVFKDANLTLQPNRPLRTAVKITITKINAAPNTPVRLRFTLPDGKFLEASIPYFGRN